MARIVKRRSLPRRRSKKTWYSEEDFENIARAISEDFLVARVKHNDKLFECAANWFFRGRDEPDRARPSANIKKLQQVSQAARKLLGHLGVDKLDDVADDFADELVEALADSAEDPDHDQIIGAMVRIRRLIEIIDATRAAKLLHVRAGKAIGDEIDFACSRGVRKRRGNLPEHNWIAEAMAIYETITGKAPDPGRGDNSNPLTRFLKAAAKPLGIKLSRDWRMRIRTARKKPTVPKTETI
jgi:hypothetical protein